MRAPAQQVNLNRLFDVFDRDGNGVVDTTELLTGLSVLTKGQGDDKIRATFHMYDTDGAFVCHGARARGPLPRMGLGKSSTFSHFSAAQATGTSAWPKCRATCAPSSR